MFHGSMVALVTPMTDKAEIDFDALHRLIDFHLEAGTHALIVAGTTGESGTLTEKEHHALIRFVVDKTKEKIPVIAGTGACGTAQTIEKTRDAMELGVDACLLLTPPYIKPTQEGLYQHFSRIAEAVAIPQILYNVPSRTGCDLLPETIARLAGTPNIIAVKEASGKLERVKEILTLSQNKIDVFSGEDALTLAMMKNGAKGVISVTSNVVPRLMAMLCNFALTAKWSEADAIDTKLQPLHKALFVESNPIPVKWILSEMDLIGTGIRLPLVKLSERFYPVVREAFQFANS